MASKIFQFPGDGGRRGRRDKTVTLSNMVQAPWTGRLLAVLAYGVLGFIIPYQFLDWNGMYLLAILGILYWALVYNKGRRKTSYFLRYHWIMAILWNLTLLLSTMVILALARVLLSTLILAQWSDGAALGSVGLAYFMGLVIPGVFWLSALYASVMALMGRTQSMGFMTRQATLWA